jgi:hypothetical protein
MDPNTFHTKTDPQQGYDEINGAMNGPIEFSSQKMNNYRYYPSHEDLPSDLVSVDEIFRRLKLVRRNRRWQHILNDSVESSNDVGNDHHYEEEEQQKHPISSEGILDNDTYPPYRNMTAVTSDCDEHTLHTQANIFDDMERFHNLDDAYDTYDTFEYEHGRQTNSKVDFQHPTDRKTIFEKRVTSTVTSRLIPSMQRQLRLTDTRPLEQGAFHGEVVPISIPDMDETSVYSSSYNDVNDDSDCTIPKFKVTQIEIAPGKYLPLRGAAETTYALQCGFYVTISCMICHSLLICIANCELVLCPDCRTLSPNTIMTLKNNKDNYNVSRSVTTSTPSIDNDISVRLDIKSGVGLGLQV